MDKKKIQHMLESLEDERNSAFLYRALAEQEKSPQLAEIYTRMAENEDKHANAWEKRLVQAGVSVDAFRPTWRARTLRWIAKRFGVATVLPSLTMAEQNAKSSYKPDKFADPETKSMHDEESAHARLLTQISKSSPGGMAGSALAQLEGRHRSAGGNALRAAVLGANDGLVSNLSLVMGVAGASLAGREILITGMAGMLAGAISMALGEWLSVQSSRELYTHQIEIESEEIEFAPEEETEELALIYQSRGVDRDQATVLAHKIMEDRTTAVEAKVREELAVDPAELGGSAWEAAITSFVLFTLGAIIPVAPFMFSDGLTAIITSIGLSMVGMFVIGAAITLFTGRPVFVSGARQMVFGLAAALVTFTIGKLIGINLAG
jgi:VIT1/CCC1 family predicted Fe2+/Mn2+ transporter